MLFSWVVSGLITPYLAVKMLPNVAKHEHGSDPYQTPFYRKLRRWIDLAIARRWLVIGATVGALAVAVIGSRFVPQQFFPNSDRPELVVELRLQRGDAVQGRLPVVEEGSDRLLGRIGPMATDPGPLTP